MTKPHAILFITAQHKTYRLGLTKVITVIGSSPEADIRLDFTEVSRRHFRISREAKGKYVIEDLASAEGTFLQRDDMEESRLAEPSTLLDRDVVRVGPYRLHFVIPEEVTDYLTLGSVKLSGAVVIVGRGEAAIAIADEAVALRHASIETYGRDTVYVITHADATTVNGKTITEPHLLNVGDMVAFANHAYPVSRDAGTEIAQGGERRLTKSLRFDFQRNAVVEPVMGETPLTESLRPKETQLANWKGRFNDLLQRLREPKGILALKIFGGVIVATLLLIPYNMNVTCECRLIAGAVQKVRAPMSGRIDKVFIKEGDHVRREEVLLRVVDRATQVEKMLADKELTASKDALERASAQDRKKRMPQIRARLAAAEHRFENAEALMDQAELRAGLAGRVMTPTPQTLENTVVSAGQEVLELAETSHVVIEALVPELDIDDIVIGQRLKANFYTDMAYDYVSTVQAIVPVAERGPLGSFVLVKAPVDNLNERLIPGTTGVAKIIGRRHMGIVLIGKKIWRLFR